MLVKIKEEVKDLTPDELWIDINDFVHCIYKKYSYVDKEEFMSLAGVAFTKVLNNYNIKYAFLTCFGRRLQNEVRDYNRYVKRGLNQFSIYNVNPVTSIPYEENLDDETLLGEIDEAELKMDLMNALRRIPKEELMFFIYQ